MFVLPRHGTYAGGQWAACGVAGREVGFDSQAATTVADKLLSQLGESAARRNSLGTTELIRKG